MERNEIIRQREEWARRVVYDARDGRAESALKALADHDRLTVSVDRDEAMDRLVSDWAEVAMDHESLRESLIFAGTNVDVCELNHRCQQWRLSTGHLSGESMEVGTLELRIGDRVMATRNHRGLQLRNGMIGTVVGISPASSTIRVAFDSGPSVGIDTNDFANLDLAYAVSTHKGQGQTVDYAFVLTGDMMTDREISYVQTSRARRDTRVYCDALSDLETIDSLAQLMNRSRPKDLAHEHLIEAG